MGSKLPKFPSGAVWKAGSVVETMWSLRANHGGGYSYRLCSAHEEATEACFQRGALNFSGTQQWLQWQHNFAPTPSELFLPTC